MKKARPRSYSITKDLPKQPRLEMIQWADNATIGGPGWQGLEDAVEGELVKIDTVGWVIKEDDTKIIVANTVSYIGKTLTSVVISKPDVLKRWILDDPTIE